MAKQKIEILCNKLLIAEVGKDIVLSALQNKKVNDFEDGIEYYAAQNYKCTAIITEDTNDFYFAQAEVLKAKDFLENYLF